MNDQSSRSDHHRAPSPDVNNLALTDWLPSFRRWGLDRTQTMLLAGILFLGTAVFLRCLANGPVWDDHHYLRSYLLTQRSFLWRSFGHDLDWFQDPSHLPQGSYYRPLQDVWYGLNRQIFGLHFLGWHLAKLAVQFLVIAVSFRLTQLLTGDIVAALWAALLFALLPVHVEAVTWVSAIPELLSGLLEMVALCYYIQRDSQPSYFFLSLLTFSCALLIHETAFLFPCIIILYAFLMERHKQELISTDHSYPWLSHIQAALRTSVPFIILSLIYLALRLIVLRSAFLGTPHEDLKMVPVNGQLVEKLVNTGRPLWQVFATIPIVLNHYLAILAVPWLAGPAHPVEFINNLGLLNFYLPISFLIILALAGYFSIRRNPQRNLYLFCAGWILVNLGAALNLQNVIALVQDRFIYASSFGWCVILAEAGVQFARRGVMRRVIVASLAAIFAMLCTVVVWHDQSFWHDDISLFQKCVSLFPKYPYYRLNLVNALLVRGDQRGAAQQYEALLATHPTRLEWRLQLAELYMKMKRPEDAEREFGAAAEQVKGLVAVYPNDVHLRIQLGMFYKEANQLEDADREARIAAAQLKELINANPADPELRVQLAVAHSLMKQPTELGSRISSSLPLRLQRK